MPRNSATAIMDERVVRHERSRKHCWETLLRMATVGAEDVVATVSKSEAMADLKKLCEDHCPEDCEVSSSHIIESNTGRPTDESEVSLMFVNARNRGYEHTGVFRAKLGDMPWPPTAYELRGKARSEPDAPLREIRLMSWPEVEAEFEACGFW